MGNRKPGPDLVDAQLAMIALTLLVVQFSGAGRFSATRGRSLSIRRFIHPAKVAAGEHFAKIL
jgi:hypothetical protein